jgi:hypothetical protein
MHSSVYYGAEICFAVRVTDEVEMLNGKSVSVPTEIKFLMKCTSHSPFLSHFVQSNR